MPHAKIAPSALDRIVACPGSVTMCAPYADLPHDEVALEGDAAHWVLAELLAGRAHPVGTATPISTLLVTDEMVAGAQLFQRMVVGDGGPGISEMPVAIERVHATECWGTPDWWRWDPIKKVLRVADYKFGHRFVDAFENWQLMGYGAGIIDMLGLDDLNIDVEIVIVQPRSYHDDGPVRAWLTRGHELRPFMNRAEHAAELALRPDAPVTTGRHCGDCEGRHDCKVLQSAVSSIVDYVGRGERVSLGGPALALELRYLDAADKLLKARKTGLEAAGEAMLRSGKLVPGYMMGQTRGKLDWNAPITEIAATMDALGKDIRKPLALCTPTQAKNEYGIDEAVIKSYSSFIPGRTRMEPEPAQQARKVFGANSK